LEDAIRHHTNFNFETTLGANTIPTLLREAAESGLLVHMYYVGLESPEMHVRRVASRVQKGGHSIPEGKIRQRYESSPRNLISLWPALHRVVLFDNSADPDDDGMVEPLRILRMEAGLIVECLPDDEVPAWAREIVAAARQFDAACRKRA
jgi:predicted ABC-type ATPase